MVPADLLHRSTNDSDVMHEAGIVFLCQQLGVHGNRMGAATSMEKKFKLNLVKSDSAEKNIPF